MTKLALRIQIFEYLLEPFHRHALEWLQSARLEKEGKKYDFPTETHRHY